jgi:hypothetical protein
VVSSAFRDHPALEPRVHSANMGGPHPIKVT